MIHQFLRLCLLRLWHKHKGSIEGVPIPSDFFFHKPRTRGGCPTICPCTEKLGGAHWQAWWSTLLSQDMCYMSMDGVSSSSVEKAGWAQETKYVNLVSQFGGRKEFFEVLWQHWISSEWCMCLVILHAGRWWSSIANSFYCWQVLRLPQPVFFFTCNTTVQKACHCTYHGHESQRRKSLRFNISMHCFIAELRHLPKTICLIFLDIRYWY